MGYFGWYLSRVFWGCVFLACAVPIWMLTGIDPKHLLILIGGAMGIAGFAFIAYKAWDLF